MRRLMASLLMLTMSFAGIAAAADEPAPKGVIVQASGERAEFKRALVLASNMHEVLKDTAFEVVVFGPNVALTTAFSDEAPLIQKVQAAGVHVVVCGRSLKAEKIDPADLAPEVTVVPFGAVHIVQRQAAGWQYLKP